MKKIICVALSLVLLALALVSCNNLGDRNETSPKNTIPTPSRQETESGSISESQTETEPEPTGTIEFDACDEAVYVVNCDSLKLRSSTSTANDTNVKAYVYEGEKLRRIGYTETWSKIAYTVDGKTVELFAGSKYLSTSKPVATGSGATDPEEIIFEDAEDYVYIYTKVEEGLANLREKPDRTSASLFVVKEGTKLQRTGIAYDEGSTVDGWSRVVYNDKVCYIRNSVISTEAPKAN